MEPAPTRRSSRERGAHRELRHRRLTQAPLSSIHQRGQGGRVLPGRDLVSKSPIRGLERLSGNHYCGKESSAAPWRRAMRGNRQVPSYNLANRALIESCATDDRLELLSHPVAVAAS